MNLFGKEDFEKKVFDYTDGEGVDLILDMTGKEYFNKNRLIIDNVDKQAYLSSLSLAKYIVVTCDSSSMISEAALTGKPVYVAMIQPKRNDKRFKKFRSLFEELITSP